MKFQNGYKPIFTVQSSVTVTYITSPILSELALDCWIMWQM